MNKKIGEEKQVSEVSQPDMGAEDLALIRAAKTGDKKAYGKLVLKYQKRLFRFVFLLLGRKDATEDAVQEALVKAYLALDSFEEDKPFYPWLSTIARNLALNQIRKSDRERPASEIEHDLSDIPGENPGPLDELVSRENDRRLTSAIASLSEAYRTVFVMRMVEKMSYEEIAEKLGISVGTVDSRLFRARQKLVEMLREQL
ncbi:MAG: sigma-70 family RNA polymerase sigma factor [candidate division Zixibacteria bacterium]|nr:sigma-70 family RNA polymerase sigma factor [candidate division Zixibacteria bacterium]